MRVRTLVGKQVDNFRLAEVDRFPLVAVSMFKFDTVEADADLRGILDRCVTDAQVEKAGIACRWLRLIIGPAAGSQRR